MRCISMISRVEKTGFGEVYAPGGEGPMGPARMALSKPVIVTLAGASRFEKGDGGQILKPPAGRHCQGAVLLSWDGHKQLTFPAVAA